MSCACWRSPVTEQEPIWTATRRFILLGWFSGSAPDAIITVSMTTSHSAKNTQRSERSTNLKADEGKERAAVRRPALRSAALEERLELLEIFGEAALDGILDEADAVAPAASNRKACDAA